MHAANSLASFWSELQKSGGHRERSVLGSQRFIASRLGAPCADPRERELRRCEDGKWPPGTLAPSLVCACLLAAGLIIVTAESQAASPNDNNKVVCSCGGLA
jgi:hypothetical protein